MKHFFTVKSQKYVFAFFFLLQLLSNPISAQWQRAVSNTTQQLNGVAFGSSKWVSVGNGGTIITSTDASVWTARNSNTAEGLNAVYYENSLWVAVGSNGTILTSVDGITWLSQVSGTTVRLNKVRYGNGLWIIVGDTGTILTSVDGTTWTRQISNTFTSLTGVVYGAGKWVISGYGSQILSSTDAINWTSKSTNVSYPHTGVSYGNGTFIVNVSYVVPIILKSTDGVTWSDQSIGSRYQIITSISHGNGLWLAAGNYLTMLASTDAVTWRKQNVPPIYGSEGYLHDAFYNSGLWVAVGTAGQIFITLNPLPVSFTSFKGRPENDSAILSWETAWEKSASHFIVQRSIDAVNFEAVGQVEAKGTSNDINNYSFTDKSISKGLWYYRLKQIDIDGTIAYSNIIAIRVGDKPLATIIIYPNPSLGELTIEGTDGIRHIELFSSIGKLELYQNFEKPVNQCITNASHLSPGIYTVKIQNLDGHIRTLQWIKK